MGGFSDNVHGLILAVSSSIFIGSSFIIKKKGLMKAGATGKRAGFNPFSFPLCFFNLHLIMFAFNSSNIICSCNH